MSVCTLGFFYSRKILVVMKRFHLVVAASAPAHVFGSALHAPFGLRLTDIMSLYSLPLAVPIHSSQAS